MIDACEAVVEAPPRLIWRRPFFGSHRKDCFITTRPAVVLIWISKQDARISRKRLGQRQGRLCLFVWYSSQFMPHEGNRIRVSSDHHVLLRLSQ